jgi:hypothetical protein
MMKKITAVLCAALLASASQILFAAPKPSLDGRAVVADSGVLPKGAFGKSIGYLPGDSVTVTNPSAGVSIDVMILGVIDSTEGIAILLSPEAAEALFISKDSQTLVTVTKKGVTGMPDPLGGEPRTAKADPDKDALRAIPADMNVQFERPPVAETKNPAPLLPQAQTTERMVPPVVSSASPENTPPKKTSSAAPTRPAATTELGENYDWIWTDREPAPAAKPAVYDEPQPEIASADPCAPVAPAAEPVESKEGKTAAAAPVAPKPEASEAIVLLVPSEPKPPASSGKQPPAAPQPPAPPPQVISPTPVPSTAPVSAPSPSGPVFNPTSVKRIQSLERGKYYVQIATFSNAESVNTVAMRYGEKYPLVQIVNDAAKSSQVLVGPLTVDEYGMVLAHFREYGYKDAFLRAGN